MNWIRENKFLTGFIAVLVIGTGVLGYLLYTAWGNYSDISDQYNAAASALHQLQVRVPYPDQKNLVAYRAERDQVIATTGSLAAALSQMVLPIEPMSPSAFQDRLRDTLSQVTADAGQAGVLLPQSFAMDFNKYQTSPPPAEAAGPLGRQLAALKIIMDILIHERVDSVTNLQRAPLTEEGTAGNARGEGREERGFGGGRGGGGGRRGEEGGGESGLVETYPFEVQFTASQQAFQKVLDDIATSSKQFFITRTLLVENTQPNPVPKEARSPASSAASAAVGNTATPGAAAAPAAGTPDTTGTSGFLKFLVGTEKLDVSMRIDIVAFNPPPGRHHP